GVADRCQGVPERDVDAAVLDIPDPWTAIRAAWTALRIGGSVVTCLPNVEQVRHAVEALREAPFVEVRTLEIIEREIEVKETGTKPSFAPLGHTGYITTARKTLDTFL